MKIIGLLSTEDEANELKYVAQVRSVVDRVHFIVHIQKIKSMLKKTDECMPPQN